MKSHQLPWKTGLVIVVIGAIGGWIRWAIATGDLLWLDELHTSWVVRGGIIEVAQRAADGNQTPLYFLLTWVSVQLFGDSEVAIRAVSLLSGFGLMLTISWVCWKWTRSSIAAIVVVVLVAFDFDQFIFYSTEARPFALLQWMSLIQVILFAGAVSRFHPSSNKLAPNVGEPPATGNTFESNEPAEWRLRWSRPDWGLAVVSAGLVYIHFTAIWIFVAEALYLAILFIGSRQRRTGLLRGGGSVAITMLLILIFCIPAVLQMFETFGRRGNWEGVSSISEFWKTQWRTIVALLGIPLLVTLVLSFVEKWRWCGEDKCSASCTTGGLVLIWAMIPTICILGLTFLEVAPICLRRYVQVGAVAFPLFAGLAIGRLSTRRCQALLATIVLATGVWQAPDVISLMTHGEIPIIRHEDWETPATVVNEDLKKQDHPLFLLANLIEDVDALDNHDLRFQNYLRFPLQSRYEFEASHRETIVYPTMTFSGLSAEHLQLINARGGAWIVARVRRPYLERLKNEINWQLATTSKRPAVQARISVLESVDSDVYLISVDY